MASRCPSEVAGLSRKFPLTRPDPPTDGVHASSLVDLQPAAQHIHTRLDCIFHPNSLFILLTLLTAHNETQKEWNRELLTERRFFLPLFASITSAALSKVHCSQYGNRRQFFFFAATADLSMEALIDIFCAAAVSCSRRDACAHTVSKTVASVLAKHWFKLNNWELRLKGVFWNFTPFSSGLACKAHLVFNPRNRRGTKRRQSTEPVMLTDSRKTLECSRKKKENVTLSVNATNVICKQQRPYGERWSNF